MKKLLIILSIVLSISLIVGLGFFIFKKSNNDIVSNQNSYLLEKKEMTSLKTADEFEDFFKDNKYEYDIADDKSIGSAFNVDFLGENMSITYYFDKSGSSTECALAYYINMEVHEESYDVLDIDSKLLSEATYSAIEELCSLFQCKFNGNLYLTNEDGSFTKIEADENFQDILDKNSYIDFSIRDKEGYYWLMRVSYDGELACINIYKDFNIESCLDYVANISLYEGK